MEHTFSAVDDNSSYIQPEVIAQKVPLSLALPSDTKSAFLAGIFIIMLLTALYATSAIVIPIILAFILKLVFQPALRALGKWHLPQPVAAAVILLSLVSILAGLGTILSGPATQWAEKIPAGLPHLEARLNFLSRPVENTEKILMQANDVGKGPEHKVVAVAVEGQRFSDKVFNGTQTLVSGLFTMLLVLFFLLASGDTFLRRLVEVLPRFKDKRQAVDISQQIEHDISLYLLTISTINACVGISAAAIMKLCGIEDPILWGALAFLLNYIPILGPVAVMIVFLLAGLLVVPNFWLALMPAFLYGFIHVLESMIITPLLLSRRFTINPVLVILSLVFWYWMWGIAGAILAMPMLSIFKIICDRINRLAAFGHFLEA